MSARGLELEDWQDRAACKGAPDPGLWFPERGTDQAEAKAICAGCPVKAECLEYALRNRIHEGVWGGLSERQRRRMRRGFQASFIARSCAFCGDEFVWRRKSGRPDSYCSDGCRRMAHRAQVARGR